MKWTIEQLNTGIKQAAAEGNMEMARKLTRRAVEMQKEAEKPNEWGLNAEDQELFGSVTSDPLFGDGKFNEFAVGMGRGLTNIGEGAKDLYMRTQGGGKAGEIDGGGRTQEQEDSLDRFNRKADEERALYEKGFGDSGWSTAGEIAGEVLPSLIPGMGVARAAQVGSLAGRTGTLSMVEGGLTEFVATRGDLGERAPAAAIGALTAGVADKALGYASHKLRSNKIDNEVSMMAHDSPPVTAEDGANPIGLTAEGQARKVRALEDGGYKLDAADSERNTLALREREALQTTGNADYLASRKYQQEAVEARANKLNGEGYKYDRDTPDVASNGIMSGSDELVQGMRDVRAREEKAVDDAYDAWRKSHGGTTKVDTNGFRSKVKTEIGKIKQGQKGVKKDIEEIMDKYGITLSKKGGAQSKPLSVDKVEEIIQEINSIYKAADDPSNRAAKGVKNALDDFVIDDGFGNQINLAPNDPRRLGKEARTKARDVHRKWDDKETDLGRLTRTSKDGESLFRNPIDSIKSIIKKGNADNVLKLKKDIEAIPELQPMWDKVVDSKRMELTAKALRANPNEFSHKAYKTAMEELDPKMRRALWGEEGAEEMERAVRAWDLRNQKPEGGAKLNNSNSAASISGAQQIAGLGVAGYLGVPLQMLAPAMRILKGQSKTHAFDVAAKALNDGSLPPSSVKTARLELRQQIADRLDGIDAKRDRNYLDAIILGLSSATRGTARVAASPDDEAADRAQRAQKLNAR